MTKFTILTEILSSFVYAELFTAIEQYRMVVGTDKEKSPRKDAGRAFEESHRRWFLCFDHVSSDRNRLEKCY